MNNAYYFQLLAGLTQAGSQFPIPRVLKDAVKSGDLDDIKSVEETIVKEASDCSLVENNGGQYFTTLGGHALMFALSRGDYARYHEISDMMSKRLESANAAGAGLDTAIWGEFLKFMNTVAKRMSRSISVEEFERVVDDLEWSDFDKVFTARICRAIGDLYQAEDSPERRGKARFWLQKSVNDSDFNESLAALSSLIDLFAAIGTAESLGRLNEAIRTVQDAQQRETDPGMQRVIKVYLQDLHARAVLANTMSGNTAYDDDQVKLEECLSSIRDLGRRVDSEASKTPAFVTGFLKLRLANCYLALSESDIDNDDAKELVAMASDDLKDAASIAKKSKDTLLADKVRVRSLYVATKTGGKTLEKDIKDALAEARKAEDMNTLLEVSKIAANYYVGVKNGAFKAYEILLEVVRRGLKRSKDGGYFLVTNGMRDINTILVNEVERPGLSWMVAELGNYFGTLTEAIDGIEGQLEEIGSDMFGAFQEEYSRMEPASHFSIKVYLRYQFYSVKLLRLAGLMRADAAAVKIADTLIAELNAENNPLTFIRAAWDEFKDVPNSVRNKVVNKCISISKGDLPLAAEHLDFSYRNLRSYITFQEVNRLGFFLDQQQTNNRQLEQGIRLMFFDLYKNGTIFEVVFDMPKFLVEHAKSGFSSQDLEEALDIKGTTAKKYIKIMMEIGLIKLERSVGRKHFYKLRKDNVMTRLSKEAKVMVV
jgi:hypothetical protein